MLRAPILAAPLRRACARSRNKLMSLAADAAAILRELQAASAAKDIYLFRDRAHALRSGAANIGARNIYKMCLSWRQIGARELASHGLDYVHKLEAEFEQVRTTLEQYRADTQEINVGA